jgi:AraC-like DNA-binding protein/quercetin dioxygenase-like cupin family protein
MSQTSRTYERSSAAWHQATEGMTGIRGLFDTPIGPIATVAAELDRGDRIQPHWHDWGQLVFSINGVLSTVTDEGSWVVPPNRAVWIPPFKKHSFQIRTPLKMHTLYIDPAVAGPQPAHCCVLQASPLLIAIVGRLLEYPVDYGPDTPQARLTAVALDEIRTAPHSPLHVPQPTLPKLVAIAQHIWSHPRDNQTLAEWGDRLGASGRTLARMFRQDTGMSFAQWRQQVRLVLALQMLAESRSVTHVAIELGYESPSAFISMFRKCLGTTPTRYFS